LAERVKSIKTELDAERFENLGESLSELRKAVEDFDRTFDERKEVIAGVEVG